MLVVFHQLVSLSRDERQLSFDGADGWDIVEAEPGRIVLTKDSRRVTVQDVPYELIETRQATPAPEPAKKAKR